MKKKIKEICENYSIFSRYIREQVKREEERAKDKGREFTIKQSKDARIKYTRRARIMGANLAGVMLLVGTIGYQAGKHTTNQQQIKDGIERQEENTTFTSKYEGDTTFTSDYRGDITIESKTQTLKIEKGIFGEREISEEDKSNSWKNDIKVDVVLPSEIAEKVNSEIEDLTTSEEILQYVKQQYVDEYNKNNKQEIKTEDIEIKKSNLGAIQVTLKKDKCIYNPYANAENSGVYTIKHNGKILEHIARTLLRGDYRQAYIDGEEQKENNTKDIYKIIAEGIDYCIGYESYEKGETSEEVLLTYKNRLMSSVYEKRMEAYQSLIKNKQSQTNRETGEELEQ